MYGISSKSGERLSLDALHRRNHCDIQYLHTTTYATRLQECCHLAFYFKASLIVTHHFHGIYLSTTVEVKRVESRSRSDVWHPRSFFALHVSYTYYILHQFKPSSSGDFSHPMFIRLLICTVWSEEERRRREKAQRCRQGRVQRRPWRRKPAMLRPLPELAWRKPRPLLKKRYSFIIFSESRAHAFIRNYLFIL